MPADRMTPEQLTPCIGCLRPVMHGRVAVRLTVQTIRVDPRRAQQQAGLELMLGGGVDGATLGAVLGDRAVLDATTVGAVCVCIECAGSTTVLHAYQHATGDQR